MAMSIAVSFPFGTDYPLMYNLFVKKAVKVTATFCFL
jgi:hypothetical protein